ncbi:MAG: hypothetical protein JKY54_08085 [Flavobacteriales bacterium]|nr:hypothetical protein [Flavobacteriales bacterium]
MKVVFTACLVTIGFLCFGQATEIDWNKLHYKSTEDVWSQEFQAYYLAPEFTEYVMNLNNKRIEITGYVRVIDPVDGYYLLVSKPNLVLGGCSSTVTSDEIIELELSDFKGKDDEKVKIAGVMEVNKEDIYRLSYIIKNVQILEAGK